jgi:4-amino-4-deoxy-L-arabinose transferase-like glycosyltransferase
MSQAQLEKVDIDTNLADKVPTSRKFYFSAGLWIILPVVATLIVRGLTTPWFIESRDGLFFVRGVERYATAEMRPHWPGYPVYIWLAKALNFFFRDPVLSLHVISVVASSLTIVPIYGLTVSWMRTLGGDAAQARRTGWLAVGLWALLPLSWIGGTEIFSDALALLLGVSLLWLVWRALTATNNVEYYLVGGAIVGGLMVGVRLSYITFLVPLLYAIWLKRAYRVGKIPVFIYALGALALSGGAWLGWQLLMEGSRFFAATNQHLAGHYSSWGGSVTTDRNLLTRPLRLLETNVIYGWGGWWPTDVPLWRVPLTLIALYLLGMGVLRLGRSSNKQPLILLALAGLPYLLWIMLGNDVDLARYSLPFIAIGVIVAGIGLPSAKKQAYATLLVTLVAVSVVSVPLGVEHRDSLPIMHRLTAYLNTNLDPSDATIIVTDDVAGLIFFVQENSSQFQAIRVRTEAIETQTRELQAQGRTIYAVGLANVNLAGWQPEVRLCRSRFLESRGPLEVWVYRYAPGEKVVAPATCY